MAQLEMHPVLEYKSASYDSYTTPLLVPVLHTAAGSVAPNGQQLLGFVHMLLCQTLCDFACSWRMSMASLEMPMTSGT